MRMRSTSPGGPAIAVALLGLPLGNVLGSFFEGFFNSDYLYVASLFMALIFLLKRGFRSLGSISAIFFLLFFFSHIIVIANTSDFDSVRLGLLGKIIFVFILLLVTLQMNSREHQYFLNGFTLLCVVVSFAILVGGWFSDGDYRLLFPLASKNYLFPSIYVACGLVLTALRLFEKQSFLNFFNLGVCFLGSLNSLGRTSLVVSFLLVFIVLLLASRYVRVSTVLSLLLVLPFAGLLASRFISGKLIERLLENDPGVRVERWGYWLSQGVESLPVGGGLGVWYPSHPHNLFVQQFAEAGLAGLLPWVILWVIPCAFCALEFANLRERKSEEIFIRLGFPVIFVIFFLEYMKSHEIHSGIVIWSITSMLISHSSELRRLRSAHPRTYNPNFEKSS